jgi:hypothetical protein
MNKLSSIFKNKDTRVLKELVLIRKDFNVLLYSSVLSVELGPWYVNSLDESSAISFSRRAILWSFARDLSVISSIDFLVISAFPKGLFSWIRGFQYHSGGASRHQITAAGSSRESRWSPLVRIPARVIGLGSMVSLIGILTFFRWRTTAGCSNLNDSIAKLLREKPDPKTRFLTSEASAGWSKGNQEAFRRGPRERPETPKQWNRQRCYRIHPYWSDNLKYSV